jgi:phage terminase large subunit
MLAAASIKKQMERANHKVVVLPRVPAKMLGVGAAKNIFNRLWIDENKCADFLQAIRHYRFKVDDDGQWSREPLHDEHSHYADALQALGQSVAAKSHTTEAPRIQIVGVSNESANVQWMGV